ncbi:hypothetical protein Dimus_014966 [Dionaea muscipula]
MLTPKGEVSRLTTTIVRGLDVETEGCRLRPSTSMYPNPLLSMCVGHVYGAWNSSCRHVLKGMERLKIMEEAVVEAVDILVWKAGVFKEIISRLEREFERVHEDIERRMRDLKWIHEDEDIEQRLKRKMKRSTGKQKHVLNGAIGNFGHDKRR